MIQIHPTKAMITVIMKTKGQVYQFLSNFHFPQKMSYGYLKFVCSEFNPPLQEKDVQVRYFGLIYFSDQKRKKVGHLLKRF